MILECRHRVIHRKTQTLQQKAVRADKPTQKNCRLPNKHAEPVPLSYANDELTEREIKRIPNHNRHKNNQIVQNKLNQTSERSSQ